MKYEALKHQGKREGGSTFDTIGETAGESGKTVQRYIRLAQLSDELLELVDKKKIGFVQGVDISYLTSEAQNWVFAITDTQNGNITTTQTAKLKEYAKNGELTFAMVELILSEKKVEERKLIIKTDKISQYFPKDYSNEDMEKVIVRLLDEWTKKQKEDWENG